MRDSLDFFRAARYNSKINKIQKQGEMNNDGEANRRYVLITGQTKDGKRFRPSDWADRLVGAMQVLGEEESQRFGEFVHLVNHENTKCVMVDRQLESVEGRLYRFLMRFADDNNLLASDLNEDEWRKITADRGDHADRPAGAIV